VRTDTVAGRMAATAQHLAGWWGRCEAPRAGPRTPVSDRLWLLPSGPDQVHGV